jgi:hypothetical protein
MSLYFTWNFIFYLSYNVDAATVVPDFDILNVFSPHTIVYSELRSVIYYTAEICCILRQNTLIRTLFMEFSARGRGNKKLRLYLHAYAISTLLTIQWQ